MLDPGVVYAYGWTVGGVGDGVFVTVTVTGGWTTGSITVVVAGSIVEDDEVEPPSTLTTEYGSFRRTRLAFASFGMA